MNSVLSELRADQSVLRRRWRVCVKETWYWGTVSIAGKQTLRDGPPRRRLSFKLLIDKKKIKIKWKVSKRGFNDDFFVSLNETGTGTAGSVAALLSGNEVEFFGLMKPFCPFVSKKLLVLVVNKLLTEMKHSEGMAELRRYNSLRTGKIVEAWRWPMVECGVTSDSREIMTSLLFPCPFSSWCRRCSAIMVKLPHYCSGCNGK